MVNVDNWEPVSGHASADLPDIREGDGSEPKLPAREGSDDADATIIATTESYSDQRLGLEQPQRSASMNIPLDAGRMTHKNSNASFETSVSLQSMKSSPAEPHVCDINLMPDTEDFKDDVGVRTTTTLRETLEGQPKHKLATIHLEEQKVQDEGQSSLAQEAPRPSFFGNMLSSLGSKNNIDEEADRESPSAITKKPDPSSPSIISHRRGPSTSSKKSNGKQRAESLSSTTSSPLKETNGSIESQFSQTGYSTEKYLDTAYYYASEERNIEFHNVFPSISQHEKLLDAFSCTLSREFPYQGKLYVSEYHICFNPTLLGWITKPVIAFKDITFMEKSTASGIFPSAISIETTQSKIQFNRFPSRDITFDLLKEVWARVLLENGDHDGPLSTGHRASSELQRALGRPFNSRSYSDLIQRSEPASRASYASENDSIIEDAIRSVDDYISKPSRSSSESDEESSSDDQVQAIGLKKTSKYKYNGPFVGRQTDSPPLSSQETLLEECELNAPPGLVFELMFSGKNPRFWLEFAEKQGTSDYTTIGSFDDVNEDGHKSRSYQYSKKLNYAIGPSSTKCYAQDAILHLDYHDYIDVVNTTKTPDVPSGSSFCTKTRYLFRWASETTCMLRISFWIEWSSSTWIKSMVESSCKSGQTEVAKQMIPFLKEFVAANTQEIEVQASSLEKTTERSEKSQTPASISDINQPIISANTITAERKAYENQTINLTSILWMITLVMLFVLLYYQLVLIGKVHSLQAALEKIESRIA